MAPSLSLVLPSTLARVTVRDIGDTVEKATGIHDWDSCMAHGYCKWPVIIGIIVVSLIALSVLFCIVKCCGCCVDCCRCISCCCGGGGRERTKYVQAPQANGPPMYPPGAYGYQPHMAYGVGPPASQFATFDNPSAKSPSATTHIHADSLPAMPSWSTATSRQVEDTSQPAEELKPLHKPDDLGYGEDIAMSRLSPSASSPRPDYTREASTGPGYGPPRNDHAYGPNDGHWQLRQHDGQFQHPQSPHAYDQDFANPYSPRSPQSPASNFPPPSYRSRPPDMDRSAYGSQTSRYAPSTDYASTVGYQGHAPRRAPDEQDYSMPQVAEMPASRMSAAPPARLPQSHMSELPVAGGWRPPNPTPAALQVGTGGGEDWRSAGQRGGVDRKPVTGSWRDI